MVGTGDSSGFGVGLMRVVNATGWLNIRLLLAFQKIFRKTYIYLDYTIGITNSIIYGVRYESGE